MPRKKEIDLQISPESDEEIDENVTREHGCYLLRSCNYNRLYIGYTVNFPRRIRQHNGEIKGGAKRTSKWRPWTPICHIRGFKNNHQALRFEYRFQLMVRGKSKHPTIEDKTRFYLKKMCILLEKSDKGEAWPPLTIQWYQDFSIEGSGITNLAPIL